MPALFETGAATHRGRVREQNEDSYTVRPQSGVWAVADGMGGHDAGALASAMLVDVLEQIEPPHSAAELLARCEEQVVEVNGRLHALAAQHGATIGTTLAVLLAYGAYYACVWSGDSRIYLIRNGAIDQLSRDHTEAQAMVDRGILQPEEALYWPRRHVVTRAIGISPYPELEIAHGEFVDDDIFVLCSDGLTGHVTDEEICRHVLGVRPQAACDALVALTLDRGASDNVTVIAVRCRESETTQARADKPAVRHSRPLCT